MFLFLSSFCLVLFVCYWFFLGENGKKVIIPEGTKKVPVVNGALPFVGHGLSFSKDILGFIRSCYQRYGGVFRLKIFRTDMIVVCDRSLCKEFFKAKENNMSLYDALDRLYFGEAFSDDKNMLPLIIRMVKSSITIRFDEFSEKIMKQANKMALRIKEKCSITKDAQNMHNIAEEMIRFVAFTSASCFISMDITNEFYSYLVKFTNLLNRIVVLTYFFPKSFLRAILNPFLRKYRKGMTRLLFNEIESYRKDPTKQDSLVFRRGVDYIDSDTGKRLTNQQIADIVVCLLYVSSENTALGLSATLVDLAMNPEWWEKVQKASEFYLKRGDIPGLFNDETIHAVVMESARINTHVFPLNRKPLHSSMTLGEWYVGDAECVGLCEPLLLMEESCTQGIFKNSKLYNPSRFLEEKEKFDPFSVTTWGAGVHLCPGKMFAIYEIKAAVALMTNMFERFHIPKEHLGPMDYFSPSAFAERKVKVHLTPLSNPVILNLNAEQEGKTLINENGDKVKIEFLPSQGALLLRNYLSREKQKELYKYTISLASKESEEIKSIQNAPTHRANPITFHNLVYTRKSNCTEEPVEWYKWAMNLVTILHNHNIFLLPEHFHANSLYAQLFSEKATMAIHKDQYVNWGISISIGAATHFTFGKEKLTLFSGDVLIADFSKVDHSVDKIIPDSQPGWFIENEEEGIETFGRARCSIQIRDISHCDQHPSMSQEEFIKMLDSY